jgi:phosphatidate cytidylyltransferase
LTEMKSVLTGAAGEKAKLPADLRLRALSALALAPVALGAVWLGGIAYLLLLALSVLLMAYEWARVTCGPDWGLDAALIAVTGLGALLTVHLLLTPGSDGQGGSLLWAGMVILSGMALGGGLAWLRDKPAGWRLAGIPYISLGPCAMVWIRAQPDIGFLLILWLLLLVWAMDIGAYFAGRAIGGPKLAPRASPNKTWAGLIGGMALSGLVGAGFGLFGAGGALAVAIASMVLGGCAQAGDIAESMIKRHFGVKDMSNMIPGHGGVLDRVDGLLSAAPLMLLFVLLGAPVFP